MINLNLQNISVKQESDFYRNIHDNFPQKFLGVGNYRGLNSVFLTLIFGIDTSKVFFPTVIYRRLFFYGIPYVTVHKLYLLWGLNKDELVGHKIVPIPIYEADILAVVDLPEHIIYLGCDTENKRYYYCFSLVDGKVTKIKYGK